MGVLNVAWWVPLAYFAVTSQMTNASTTVYLHRSMAHRGLKLSPAVSFLMRFWLWLTTGINTKEWVACHRKHHAHVDREGDPHSPFLTSVSEILFKGWGYYRKAVQDTETVEKYGKGTPDDWWERRVFTRHPMLGLGILLGIDLVLLGWLWGAAIWVLQIVLMPLQGGIVNGLGHAWGYRNFESNDHSTNLIPFGLWLTGEELHNNHHADPKAARFRKRWFEIDVGWIYVRILEMMGLATDVHRGKVQLPG